MNLRVTMSGEVKSDDTPSRSESEAEEAVQDEVPVTRDGGPHR